MSGRLASTGAALAEALCSAALATVRSGLRGEDRLSLFELEALAVVLERAQEELAAPPSNKLAPAAGTAIGSTHAGCLWRDRYAWEAAAEICAIAKVLLRECPEPDADLVRGLALRLGTLGCVVMSTQDKCDDGMDVAERLFGTADGHALVLREGLASGEPATRAQEDGESGERWDLVRSASYEVEALLGMLKREARNETDDGCRELVLGTTLARIAELAAVVSEVAHEDERRRPLAEIRAVLSRAS